MCGNMGKFVFMLQLRTKKQNEQTTARGSIWKSKNRPTKSPKYLPKQKALLYIIYKYIHPIYNIYKYTTHNNTLNININGK